MDSVAQAAYRQPVEAAKNPDLSGDHFLMDNVPTGNQEPSAAAAVDAEVRPF